MTKTSYTGMPATVTIILEDRRAPNRFLGSGV